MNYMNFTSVRWINGIENVSRGPEKFSKKFLDFFQKIWRLLPIYLKYRNDSNDGRQSNITFVGGSYLTKYLSGDHSLAEKGRHDKSLGKYQKDYTVSTKKIERNFSIGKNKKDKIMI